MNTWIPNTINGLVFFFSIIIPNVKFTLICQTYINSSSSSSSRRKNEIGKEKKELFSNEKMSIQIISPK